MTTRRVGALAVALAVVAGACAAPSDPSPPATASAPPAASPTRPPAIGDLRVTAEGWRTDFTIASVSLLDFTAGGPPRDGIPAIDRPVFESIAAARSWLAPTSPVVAVELGGAARAYPLAILVWHEIVNDTLGGVPIVVTFCPLCHTALVYERELDGVVHRFGTTGNLRYLDLVMYDRASESWWQQATGEALVGSLTGSKLRFVRSQLISLEDFAAAYPDGDVLSRDTGAARPYDENPYPGLDRADRDPLAYVNQVDHRLEAKERVVTLDLAGSPLAVRYVDLEARGVIEIDDGPEPVVLVWKPGTTSALDRDRIDVGRDVGATGAFSPVVEGRTLTFGRAADPHADATMIDDQTGTSWSITGHAIDGPLAGSRLEPIPHGDVFWFAWATFAPETRIWGREGSRLGSGRPFRARASGDE